VTSKGAGAQVPESPCFLGEADRSRHLSASKNGRSALFLTQRRHISAARRHIAAGAIIFPEVLMTIGRRFLLIAVPLAFLNPAGVSWAQEKSAWNGTWTGLLGNISPIAVTIADDKVVSYTTGGAAFDIQYSEVTPTKVSFGDRDHYFMKLVKTGDTTALARVHGRLGYGSASLAKQ
jgi:hypothetical protein